MLAGGEAGGGLGCWVWTVVAGWTVVSGWAVVSGWTVGSGWKIEEMNEAKGFSDCCLLNISAAVV